MAQTARKEERFELRATPQDKAIISRAAKTTGLSYSAFMISSARDRATEILMDQTQFVLDKPTWKRFKASLEAPSQPIEALVELFRSDL